MTRTLLAAALGIGVCACAREAPPARPAAGPATAGPAATPGPAAPAASPIAVRIEFGVGDASAVPLAREWARELEAVLADDPGQFRLVQSEKEADLTVRIERVVTPSEAPGHHVMTLWLAVRDKPPGRFTLDYTSGPALMAGKLARFLAGHFEKVRTGAASGPASPSAHPSR
jgi:hypothetical protein